MEILPVSSSSNSLLKRIRLLQTRSGRDKANCFLIEGIKVFDEAIKHGVKVTHVVVNREFLASGISDCKSAGELSTVTLVEDERIFGELATTETPQGLIAIAERTPHEVADLFHKKDHAPLVVIADRVQDPGNLGTMFRTALAMGASGMILTKGSVDAYNPKVVRSASGALFALPFVEQLNIQEAIADCKKQGLAVLALSAGGSTLLKDANLKQPCALLLGNEANGLDKEAEDAAHHIISIPMEDKSESLNVAIASAIVLYEAMSQRAKNSDPPVQ